MAHGKFRIERYGQAMTETQEASARPRGRPPAASREDVLEAALYRYLRGKRVDIREIAAELGLGRTTIYRWFGSREELIGEVVIRAVEPVVDAARAGPAGAAASGSSTLSTASTAAWPRLRPFASSCNASAEQRFGS